MQATLPYTVQVSPTLVSLAENTPSKSC